MEKYYSINEKKCSVRCKCYVDDPHAVSRVILYGHGFGGSKETRSAERFANRAMEKNKGLALISFDWPCHGSDAKKALRLEDCLLYLDLVVSDAKTRFQTKSLCAYATSFGAYLFLLYLLQHGSPFRKLALRCPAVDAPATISGGIATDEQREKLAKGKAVSLGYDRKVEITAAFLDELRRAALPEQDFLPWADDILILHGTKDELVPFEPVKRFAETNLIDFVPVEGADHRFLDPKKMDEAILRILRFFDMK